MDFNEFIKKLEKNSFYANLGAMAILLFLTLTAVYLSLTFYTHHGNHVVVPNVIGKDYEEAKELLTKAGLRVHVTDTGYVKSLPANLILDQQIPAGSTVKYNRPVLLTINSDHPQMKQLPEIIDGSARSAEIMLKSMGFKIGKRKLVPGDDDLVMLVEVDGKPVETGQRISVESPIVLVVGNGKVTDIYNGNDSLDWALSLEIQETEARQKREKQELLDRLRAERAANEAGEGTENTLPTVPSVPAQTTVTVEKVGTIKKSSDIFKR